MGFDFLQASSLHAASPLERPRKSRVAECKNCPILKSLKDAGLPTSTIQDTCASLSEHPMRRRQILFLEGNTPTHFYAVRSGKIKLLKNGENGREHVTAILGSGDLLGFETIFGGTHSASAEVLNDGEICQATSATMQGLLAKHPELILGLLRYTHQQLCRSREQQVATSNVGARTKLAGYLLHLLNGLSESERKESTIAHELTLRDLGGILGLSPETVCRGLTALRSRGIIETQPSGIRVLNEAALCLMARL